MAENNDIQYKDRKAEDKVVCPDCNSILQHTEGCILCYSCGWSRC